MPPRFAGPEGIADHVGVVTQLLAALGECKKLLVDRADLDEETLAFGFKEPTFVGVGVSTADGDTEPFGGVAHVRVSQLGPTGRGEPRSVVHYARGL
jgi:hypothetical protein